MGTWTILSSVWTLGFVLSIAFQWVIFFFPPALGIFLSCIWGSILSEIVKVLSPQISRPFFTEFAPLWHSFLKILVNSAPMKGAKPGGEGRGGGNKKKKKGTKPPNFVLPTQKDWLALFGFLFPLLHPKILSREWADAIIWITSFVFIFLGITVLHCLLSNVWNPLSNIYTVQFSSCSRENHYCIMRRSRNKNLLIKSFNEGYRDLWLYLKCKYKSL